MILFPPKNPFIFQNIRYYGLFMALSLLFGTLFSLFISKKFYKESDSDFILDLVPILIIFGIIGARLYYVLLNLEFFIQNPSEIIMINHGGMSIHGALILSFLSGFIYMKIKKVNFLMYLDILTFGLILGQIIGRLGNFCNQEAFGRPTDFFIKMYVDETQRPLIYHNYNYFHPTFLYEMIWNFIVLIILFVLLKKEKKPQYGTIFSFYLILYSIGRFFIEKIRIDSVLDIFQIPIAQIVSVLLIFIGFITLFKISDKEN